MSDLEFDYVIVGSGGAGGVLARTLAERTNATVAVLEAGPSDEGKPEILDYRRYMDVRRSALARLISIVPPAQGNGRFQYPISRVLGGSTSQNSCIWLRPPASDFDDWEAAGAAGWGPEGVMSHFATLETRINIEEVFPDEDSHRVLWQAAEELGFEHIDFAKAFDEGMGRYRMSKAGSERQSTAVVFLRRYLPNNLAVFTETEVQKLIIGPDNEVQGVETSRGPIRARREVVLSAGALDTPKLLMLTGIGPAAQLKEFGIEVKKDLRGVGAHLLDHPIACVNVAATGTLARDPDWNYSGIIFTRAEADAVWPDIEVQVGPELFEQQTKPAGYPSAPNGFTAYIAVNRARSEGTVRLASTDVRDNPIVDPAYFSDPDGYDLRVMIGGVRMARQLFATPTISGWIDRELAPGDDAESDEELGAYVRDTATTGYHPAGTCAMGAADNPNSVVDPELKVVGVRRLRVADASVMPTMVSVNIAPTCMMIGHRAAALIAGKMNR
ncbi:MAG: GMC family oxidoreductase N-terminal domain-containing protein [Hyphomicrobiales bacterium]